MTKYPMNMTRIEQDKYNLTAMRRENRPVIMEAWRAVTKEPLRKLEADRGNWHAVEFGKIVFG